MLATVRVRSLPCAEQQLNEPDGAAQIGLAIVAAPDGSEAGVRHPRDWSGVLSLLLTPSGQISGDLLRVRDVRGSGRAGGRVSLGPARNLGAVGGFEATSTNQVLPTRARSRAVAIEERDDVDAEVLIPKRCAALRRDRADDHRTGVTAWIEGRTCGALIVAAHAARASADRARCLAARLR